MTKVSTVPAIVIKRVYDAAPERVYAVWTNREIAMKLLSPNDVTVSEMEMDVREGGSYRTVFQTAEGPMTVKGIYKEVAPGRRLSFTWRWEEDNPEEERDTLVTIDFAPHGSGTELTLTHEFLASDESSSGHKSGWESILDKLPSALSYLDEKKR